MLQISLLRLSLCHNSFVTIRSIGYYITTPIFYVNASPHIGHVHTLFLADAINIFNRLKIGTNSTILSTGTDEHGIKIQTAASANNMTSQEFCDLNAAKFIDLFKRYDTTVTDFIRTTEQRHKKAVQTLWNKLDDKGFIYKSTYSGWYCVSEETFVPDTQVKSKSVNGQTVHHDLSDNTVVWSSEENYMFRMSKVEDQVKSWLSQQRPVVPEKFNEIVLKSIERSHLGDISISRPKKRLEWGIEVPNDPEQTIYVWLDALTSYLTVAGYPCEKSDLRRWPVDCHVLGKDIIKFHAIYWPAFLLALSLPLPKKLLCHSHWTLDSMKMSKSKGNVVDPLKENSLLTEEGLRYYLLRASTNHSDTDYNNQQALRRVNAELADTYGNLMSRCCGKTINPEQIIPKSLLEMENTSLFRELLDELKQLAHICEEHFENADFYKGVDQIMAVLRLNNKLYEDTQPWKLVRTISTNPESFKIYHNLQAITFETLRICSILLQPVVPRLSDKALSYMKVQNRSWKDARLMLELGSQNDNVRLIDNSNFVLFKRIK
jgi:methionyl-tRNA synthetase